MSPCTGVIFKMQTIKMMKGMEIEMFHEMAPFYLAFYKASLYTSKQCQLGSCIVFAYKCKSFIVATFVQERKSEANMKSGCTCSWLSRDFQIMLSLLKIFIKQYCLYLIWKSLVTRWDCPFTSGRSHRCYLMMSQGGP